MSCRRESAGNIFLNDMLHVLKVDIIRPSLDQIPGVEQSRTFFIIHTKSQRLLLHEILPLNNCLVFESFKKKV